MLKNGLQRQHGHYLPVPALGRCKFLVQGCQAQQVTSLGTLLQAGLCLSLALTAPALASRGTFEQGGAGMG